MEDGCGEEEGDFGAEDGGGEDEEGYGEALAARGGSGVGGFGKEEGEGEGCFAVLVDFDGKRGWGMYLVQRQTCWGGFARNRK